MNRDALTTGRLPRRLYGSIFRKQPRHRAWFILCALVCLSACSGLGGEPRIVATFPPATRAPDTGLPSQRPELAQGAAIFAENCTRCHGVTGQGDGPLVVSGQLPTPPPDFTDPATTRDQTVTAWFDVITHGRLENLMPPWGDTLTETERWAVAIYTYTLNYPSDQVTRGKSVWNENCASCHGDTGTGDGPRAGEFETVIDLTEPAALVAKSDAALFNLLSTGTGSDVHAFSATLDDTERWAAVAFTRTLSLADAELLEQSVPPPVATEEVDDSAAEATEAAAVSEAQGVVRGQVVNGTADGAVSSGLTVTLRIFDSEMNPESLETTVNEDGSFVFEDVSIRADYGYLATTSYLGRTFSSEMKTGEPSAAVLDLPITVFETTSDASAISINSFLAQISAEENSLQVAQILSFRNASDRVFSLDETVDGDRHISIRLSLPPGARIMNTANETDRYGLSDDGATLLDTQPVYPGQNHIVHVIYSLPYNGSTRIELPFDYALEGSAQLLVESGSLRVSSQQLPLLGTQSMGSLVVEAYGAELSLPAGEVLSFEISGSAATESAVVQPNNVLPYAFIAAGSLFILVAAALFYFGRRLPTRAGEDQRLRQMLIEQIAALDDLNQNGQIDPKAYAVRRQELKARLSELMKDK